MKKLLAMLLALVMISTILLSMPMTASAESLYIRKIVSVVYDDSGSMSNSSSNDRYVYANYAMQAFCGMLNSEDKLFITYMNDIYSSNFRPSEIDLSASGIQASVDAIRSHHHKGSYTPYAAVTEAMAKLRSVQDSNINTQYWLVIISDGGFNDENVPRAELDKRLSNFTQETMPNGTHPQVSFMSIGSRDFQPTENTQQGIYTYYAGSKQEIVNEMAKMADKVSGRTRLSTNEIKKVDDKTIQVQSAIPLLNIAVLLQDSEAKVVQAGYAGSNAIPISRKATLGYEANSVNKPNNPIKMSGSAFLIGDSQNVIAASTYNITFDSAIDLSDVVVLYEPALETRMTITVNGKEVSNFTELNETMAGDKISISCKVYEMGTNNEINPSLLPPDTKFSLTISENGQVVKQSNDASMTLTDYELQNLETVLTAAVKIEGFNAIQYSVNFTPVPYVPKVVYTVVPSFGSEIRSVKFDDIGTNQDLSVCFTVLADGVPITDVNAVKALAPSITVSPAGNAGAITYSSDGKIVFTPNAASMPSGNPDSFKVDVTCTLAEGVTATESYTVLIAAYEIFPQNSANSVIKTKLFGNQESVSFYITKDGVRLGKADVENQFSVLLNESHSHLKTLVTVAEDGLITVTPYDENEWKSCWFFTRWWQYMFSFSGDDIQVTLSHSFGTASATIDVVEENIFYILLNVVLPIAVWLFLLWWAYCIWKKPRFLPDAVLYVANLSYYNQNNKRYHEVSGFETINLCRYNHIKYRLSPTLNAKKINVCGDIVLSATDGGGIVCHCEVWYKGEITPKDRLHEDLSHPQLVMRYVEEHDELKIETISVYEDMHIEESIDNPNPETYYVNTNVNAIATVNGREVIDSGKIFAYAIRLDN